LTARAFLDLRVILSHLKAKAAPSATQTEGRREQPGPAQGFVETDPDSCGPVQHG